MRQTRLSIGCQDWQEITAKIGPAATGVLLYLRLTMRNMQASEITTSTAELAEALKLDAETVDNLICMILDAELLDAVPGSDGLTTYQSKEEAAALADRFRKRATAARRKLAAMSANLIPYLSGNSGPEIPAEIPARQALHGGSPLLRERTENQAKSYETEVFMCYDGNFVRHQSAAPYQSRTCPGGNSGRESREKEKAPRTPEKEKCLTEQSAPASAPVREVELPADKLEAEYIDICGAWPPSLRKAIRGETEEVREAFYLCVRKRQADEGCVWSADKVRMIWLAARRIPEERRADSILAWGMAGWRTIRDVGSGMYFEKETGRIVSLVRGPVQTVNPGGGTASKSALDFARKMRRA